MEKLCFIVITVALVGWVLYSFLRHLGITACSFCGSYRGTKKVKHASGYDLDYVYHEDCLRDVLDNPEKCGHSKVDIAIDIQQSVRMNQNSEKESFDRAKRLARIR